MERFIVSARKYRPQNFSTVVGQEHITTTLKNAIINNQLAHAFLFCGPRGVGKTTCARILAKTINCENRTPEGEACNECASCVSFNKGTSLNIHELDAASNNSVDDIRALVEQVRFAPQAGKYKVYIIDEVHMLSSSAFNAFLKTLEEPPPYAIFILATTEKHKILPTILSRCQIFDFKRISNAETVVHLKEIAEKEHIKADETALHLIAQKGEGCMRDALSLFDKIVSFTNGDVSHKNTLTHLNILDEDYYFKLIDNMQQQQVSEVLLTFDEINRKGFDGDIFLGGFAEFLRNLLVCQNEAAIQLLEVADDFKPKYKKAAKEISTSWIVSALNIISDSEIALRQANNKRLQTELTLIKLTYLNQVLSFTDGGEVKKKLTVESKSVSFRSLSPHIVPEAKEETKKQSPQQKAPVEKPRTKLVIETPKKPAARPKGKKPAFGNFKSLEEIQRSVSEKIENDKQRELNIDELHLAWSDYINQLEKENQTSAADSFKRAKLVLLENDQIEIVADSSFHQYFIEDQRADLINHLQTWFNNRLLTFTVRVEQKEQEEDKERYLTSRQRYLQMIEEFPAIKELKERLGLKIER